MESLKGHEKSKPQNILNVFFYSLIFLIVVNRLLARKNNTPNTEKCDQKATF